MDAKQFTRSNVNAATLSVSDPKRSSFNLSHKVNLTPQMGRFVPVQCEVLLPSDVIQGSLTPNLQFEKIMTPQLGPVRLDTHTFVVNMRRINKDFKGLLDGNQYESELPTFHYYSLVNKFFDFFASNIDGSFVNRIDTICNSIDSYLLENEKNILMYRKDSLSLYRDYLKNLPYYTDPSSYTSDKDFCDNFCYFICDVIKPFFGPASLFDMLGYPVFHRYSAFVSFYNQEYLRWQEIYKSDSSELSSFFSALKQLLSSYPLNSVSSFLFDGIAPSTGGYEYKFGSLNMPQSFSELPLRAYYAAWFDYIRNWHVEERKNILDPDNFGSASIIDCDSFDLPTFFSFCDLQYRNFTTDFLNSIQTDADFRHVYSPILGSDGTSKIAPTIYTDDVDFDSPDIIEGISSLEFAQRQIFPRGISSLVSSESGEGINISVLADDLQTMRRSGMLETWLARNYYYPDNYVGQLQARYGIKPSDYNILLSDYIGGSESFINGDQQVANVGTESTPVGQRTLVANASGNDSFSYKASDYSILISMISLVPIVNYDVAGSATMIKSLLDLPQPEFATDARFQVSTADFLRGFSIAPAIGYVPRYYSYRVHGDETHGKYLTDIRYYNWLRDWYSMYFGQKDNLVGEYVAWINHDFSLTPYHLRVHVSLDAFLGLNDWDPVAFGTVDIGLSANRPLPAAVEFI